MAVSDIRSAVQDMLLGWRHVRSDASYTRRYPDTTLLARGVSGHVGDCRPRRRRP